MGTPDRRQPVTTYTTRAANYVALRTLEDVDGLQNPNLLRGDAAGGCTPDAEATAQITRHPLASPAGGRG